MLHHVIEYARNHVPGSEPGFTMRPIHWLLHVSPEGRYINIEPYGERGKGKRREVRCPDMPNMRAGKDAKRAHFLVENTLAAVLYTKDKKSGYKSPEDDKATRRNAYFTQMLHDSAVAVPNLKPAANFFSSATETERLRQALGVYGATSNDWLMFCIETPNENEPATPYLPHEDGDVLTWWRAWLANDASAKAADQALDLISGEMANPKDRHPPLKGLEDVGANPAGAPLICFDKQAFGSYGLKDGANASMSAINAQLYADGLTHLLKSSQKIAGTRVAYWYHKDVPRTDDPLAWLAELYTEELSEAGALASARDLLKAIEDGKRPGLVENRFFALTLSGSKGRTMVRDWMEGDFKELAASIRDWFSDLGVVAISGKKAAPEQKLETVVTSLLAEKKRNQKYDDWVKPIGPARRQLFHAAIQSRQIPVLVIERVASLLPAFMCSDGVLKALFPAADRSDDDSAGLTVSRLYARMGLIRAFFVRLHPGGDKTMTPYLNPDHTHPAYHCGRLLAVLAHLQREALDDVGASVVQRFYSGFSQAPGLHLGRLIANAQNHLTSVRKKSPGLASCYEDVIAEVQGRLMDGKGIRKLNLEQQGLFALGFYQQMAQLRADRVCNIAIINRQGVQQ